MLDSASIDIQLQLQDKIGNILYWTLTPAFTVGKMPVVVDIEEMFAEGGNVP